jgi:branched-chain amino acid transport system substrate-binding protein
VRPFSPRGNPAYAEFAQTYRERYGTHPVPNAAYTYDAMHLLMRALQLSGLNRAGLREAIAGLSNFQGVTGTISWDNGGGNRAKPILRLISGKASILQ